MKRLADISGVEVAASVDKTGVGAGAEGGFDFTATLCWRRGEGGCPGSVYLYFYVGLGPALCEQDLTFCDKSSDPRFSRCFVARSARHFTLRSPAMASTRPRLAL